MRNIKFWKLLQCLAVGLALLLMAVSSGNKEAGRPMEQGDGNEFVIEDGVLIMYTGTDTEVIVPDEVTSIGDYAFSNCSALTSITLPGGVSRIGNYAFEQCSSLTRIQLPSGLASIGNRAFSYCSSLTSLELPSGLTEIGGLAFYDCDSLTNLAVAEGNATYRSFNGCLYSASGEELICCPAGKKEITLLEGVTSIGDGAFSNCRRLKRIELPSGLTNIGNWAFELCSGLTRLELPSGVVSIGDYAFESCIELSRIELPSTVTSIGECAFVYCSSLTIYGETGSYAERYAKENDIPFEPLGGF